MDDSSNTFLDDLRDGGDGTNSSFTKEILSQYEFEFDLGYDKSSSVIDKDAPSDFVVGTSSKGIFDCLFSFCAAKLLDMGGRRLYYRCHL